MTQSTAQQRADGILTAGEHLDHAALVAWLVAERMRHLLFNPWLYTAAVSIGNIGLATRDDDEQRRAAQPPLDEEGWW